jgi:hypothetical protein
MPEVFRCWAASLATVAVMKRKLPVVRGHVEVLACGQEKSPLVAM